MFSSVAPVRDAIPPAVAETDAAAQAAVAEAGAQGESFDAVMNFLLGAVTPAESAAVAAEGSLPASPLEATSAADGGAGVTTDVVADLEAIAACLPASPAAETLPPGGNTLPSAAQDPGVDAAEDALSLLSQDQSIDVPPSALAPDTVVDEAAAAISPLSPAAEAAQAALVRGAEPSVPVDAAVADQFDSTPAAPPLPATPGVSAAAPSASTPISTPAPAATSSPAAVEPAVRDATTARPEAIPRTDTPLPPDTGSGHQAASQDGDTRGQARLQELLARLGGSDGAARTPGETFRNLLQGAEGGAPGNAAALTYAQTGVAGPARDPAVPNLPVHTPLRHPEWSDEVSQRIRWAIGNQVQSAELKINPPQLGPLEVRVSVDADRQMSVTLSSQHALVRETLQESLPRLRELMSEHGFGAVNVDVSQHSPSDGRKPSAQAEPGPAARAGAEAGAEEEADTGAVSRRDVRGLVDIYA